MRTIGSPTPILNFNVGPYPPPDVAEAKAQFDSVAAEYEECRGELKAAKQAVIDASAYCTLEYDLETGKRGRRGRRAEELLIELTGAEDALVVNNCAAAAFFVLTVFASGGEVIISRGELVEIGGDFRVPDVLEQSGATLREVGTTNRTKLADYQKAISDKTKMILRVHPSNYRILGFTSTPPTEELAGLAKRHGVFFFEDVGSGALVDLSEYGPKDEPVIPKVISGGAPLVAFSGDKLLGGPQCGVIAGATDLIERLRRHPLHRALRPDKLTFAALEATLASYRRGTHFEDIPVLRQISVSSAELRDRNEALLSRLSKVLEASIISGNSVVGGGSAPGVESETPVIALSHQRYGPDELAKRLRHANPPVISRIESDRLILDLRTVAGDELEMLITVLSQVS